MQIRGPTAPIAIADRLGIETEIDAEVEELKEDVAPERVLDKIEERRQ